MSAPLWLLKDPEPPKCVEHTRWNGAGCTGCNKRNAWQKRYRRRMIAYGTWDPMARRFVSARPAMQHLDWIRKKTGAGYRKISRATGLCESGVQKLITGKYQWITRDTERVVLALEADDTAVLNFVPIVGTVRRLHALSFLGWSNRDVFAAIGKSGRTKINHRQRYINRGTAEAIERFFQEHCTTVGPTSHSATMARVRARQAQKRGQEWASPMAWEGVDMNDPKARPRGMDPAKVKNYRQLVNTLPREMRSVA